MGALCVCVCFSEGQKLTLNQEEEAQDPSGGDDESRDDEGHSPLGGDEGPSDEGAQDVSHRGVGVPHAHDEAPPVDGNTSTQKAVSGLFELRDRDLSRVKRSSSAVVVRSYFPAH